MSHEYILLIRLDLQLPKILLPEQEDELNTRIANIDELITDETAALFKEKEEVAATVISNRARIEELVGKLADLRKQVKPLEIRGRADIDELGRTRRRNEDRDSVDIDREDDRAETKEREAGVQIRGEDGDVEVEY